MRIERREAKDERRVLIGMIVDDLVLARVASQWEKGLFRSRWSNLIASWCIKYHDRYGCAPQGTIESIFESWSTKGNRDKESVAMIDRFLSRISDEHERLSKESNSDYVIDLANNYFNRVRYERLIVDLQASLTTGELKDTEAVMAQHHQVQLNAELGVDILQDDQPMHEIFSERQKALIEYRGDLGKFFGDAFQRDGFIALMGPEKRGKSFWLIDIAWRAMLQRRRVAFFEVGDMSQRQIMERVACRVCKRPLKQGSYDYPTDIEFDRDEEGKVKAYAITKTKKYQNPLTIAETDAGRQRVMERSLKSYASYFKLSCSPSDSMNVKGIESILMTWEKEGWVPDVIIIDYADILASPPGRHDGTRDEINKTWKQLRGMSQAHHCLVVTATQSDASSYSVNTLSRRHFTDDKRKLAHVTGMIGLNADDHEKTQGIMRLNWIVRRSEEYHEKRVVYVAGSLPFSAPSLKSKFLPAEP